MSLSQKHVGERLRKLLANLSPEQVEAVKYLDGALLIDAGAGSGKTRTLTRRIAYMMLAHGVKSQSILAATFTKAAAVELQGRVRELSGADVRVCTLHSWGQQIVQRFGPYRHPLRVCAEADQESLVSGILKHLGERDVSPGAILSAISDAKNRWEKPATFQPPPDLDPSILKLVAPVWETYESVKDEEDLLDFDDLLIKSVEILHSDGRALQTCHDLWKHILVDEFQDTNSPQYAMIRTVFEGKPVLGAGNPCPAERIVGRSLAVVGDGDQAIYGFRGGNVDLILGFADDYPGCKVVELSTNYRSQRVIVNAAAAVVSNNRFRTQKQLRAHRQDGRKVRILEVASPEDAAKAVAAISRWLWKATRGRAETSALFRRNKEMDSFRTLLEDLGIRTRRTGGMRFEQMPQVIAVNALVQAARDPRNDFKLLEAAKLILPQNRRLPYTLVRQARRERAQGRSVALWDVVARATDEDSGMVREAILRVIAKAHVQSGSDLLQVLEACHQTGWVKHLHDDFDSKQEARETLDELCRRLLSKKPTQSALKALLSPGQGFVELTTAHRSKGLERDYIFLLDCQEGIFPDDKADIEEERRLFYVAMTRAKEQLFIIHLAENPSRFLSEIPEEMAYRARWT